MADLVIKRPAEVRSYTFEFKNLTEIVNGDTLSGTPTVTFDVSGLTVGSPGISGTSQVKVSISGGTDGQLYQGTCTCTTAGGATLVCRGNLQVLSGLGS